MLSLDQKTQAAFVGVRSTFYRIATIVGSGLLVVIAGELESRIGNQAAWSVVFVVMGILFLILFFYHKFILPYPDEDRGTLEGKKLSINQTVLLAGGFLIVGVGFFLSFEIISFLLAQANVPTMWQTIISTISLVVIAVVLFRTTIASLINKFESSTYQNEALKPFIEFLKAFVVFMQKKDIWTVLGFLLFFRFAEAQLVKLVQPFLLDPRDKGGLGLSTSEVGIVYGTIGVIALTAGGLLGGYLISKKGLRWWLWPMVIIMHTPDLAFVYLSHFMPTNIFVISTAVAFEQFGYGFGFTAYMMYMIMISQGEYKTAHYAICTGIMALGMMIPGMFSGALQESIGYSHFFLWVVASTIPGFIVTALVKINPEFGIKTK